MSQITVIFIYNEKQIEIQCLINEKLSLICEKFIAKLQLDKSQDYYYLYGGNIINKYLSLSLEVLAINEDKRYKRMKIIVHDEMEEKKNNNEKEINEVICPECRENILIKIEE